MLALFLSLLENEDDRRRFTEIYEQYHWKMEQIAINILEKQHDAEDREYVLTDRELNAMMRQVLIDAMKLDLDAGDDSLSFNASPQHQRQMSSMLKDPLKWAVKKLRPKWKAAVQKVAAVLLMISLGFGTVMIASPTARATFVRWVTEWYETHII